MRKEIKIIARLVAGLLCLWFALTLTGCGHKTQTETSAQGSTVSASAEIESQPENSAISSDFAAQSSTAASNQTVTSTPAEAGTSSSAGTKSTTSAAARREVSVTIPEGYSFMQIARLLEQKGVCGAKEFYQACQSYTPKSFSVPASADRCFKMEGYLFPDTYFFYAADDPAEVLIKLLNNFNAQAGGTEDETLILASMIEKEARSTEQMRLVSSVFHNRLAAGMYLDCDPTRDYVNNDITGNKFLSATAKYAALYNTCQKRLGLPAGPICNPGLRAINAAKKPADTDYYYFFFGKDGQNHYSKTLAEHNKAMAEYGVDGN